MADRDYVTADLLERCHAARDSQGASLVGDTIESRIAVALVLGDVQTLSELGYMPSEAAEWMRGYYHGVWISTHDLVEWLKFMRRELGIS